MDTLKNIETPYEKIVAFCRKWHVKELALFGSVLRDDFRPDSDIDVLVEFEGSYTLQTLLDMEDELKALFGREIDLLVRHVIEQSENPYRRKGILGSAQVIYHER